MQKTKCKSKNEGSSNKGCLSCPLKEMCKKNKQVKTESK